MSGQRLAILQLNTEDVRGGAAIIASALFKAYRTRGHGSWLAVAKKESRDPDVLVVPALERHRRPARFRSRLQVGKRLDRFRGVEDFRFPGSWQLLTLPGRRPDVLHCHNLHGGYFDLRALPWLSKQVPVVLTLHDAWLLSGHCAHSFDCERWKTGCGDCPDLTIYPAVRRDATAHNWRRKREIFEHSRLHVAAPSRWLMQKVEQSMLAAGVIEARIIPNGVDLSIFHPAAPGAARAALEISPDARVVLFAAQAPRQNVWKDYQTVQDAVALIAERIKGDRLVFLALGQDPAPEQIGPVDVRFVSYQTDLESVASCYQAADVYVHAARADTFPNTVLEALACGTPVVATAVGGIPEQIDDGLTGFLVPAGDAHALADRLTQLLADAALRRRMATRGVETARREFDVRQQADAYLGWYHELVHERRAVHVATRK
jgi:glycosyltransferase involved in cell wall biosynthesis